MSKFLETYGVAIFTLVLIAILIAFAGPLGLKIKEYTLEKAEQTEQIGKDEITVATGGTVRPAEPAEAVDQIWCYLDKNGELVISQNKITAPDDAIAKEKQLSCPSSIVYMASQIKTVRFIGAVKPKTCRQWFYYCRDLTEIKNIENLYTNECTDMYDMFDGCEKLISLDVSHFDTSNVTNMSCMFRNCENLTSLDVSGFDTSKVTNMSLMFSECKNLTSLDVSNFNTENVTNMRYMFEYCKNLTSLNLSGWNTENVTNMEDMFKSCYNLTSLYVSEWNTKNVTNMEELFCSCQKLTSLDISGWNTENVTDMRSMFSYCYELKSITAPSTVQEKILNSKSNTRIPSSVTWTIK